MAFAAFAAAAPVAVRADAIDRGLAAFYARDFARAQADFDSVRALAPDDDFALAFSVACAAHEPGGFSAFARAARTELERGYLAVAQVYAGQPVAAAARASLERALAAAPRSAAARVALGSLALREGHVDDAKREFVAALRDRPDDVLAREQLAVLDQTELREPASALRLLSDLPNEVPGYADARFHLGSVLVALGQRPLGEVYLLRALDLDPDGVGETRYAYVQLAQAYASDGRPGAARATLERAIARGVDVDTAKTLLAKLERGAR